MAQTGATPEQIEALARLTAKQVGLVWENGTPEGQDHARHQMAELAAVLIPPDHIVVSRADLDLVLHTETQGDDACMDAWMRLAVALDPTFLDGGDPAVTASERERLGLTAQ